MANQASAYGVRSAASNHGSFKTATKNEHFAPQSPAAEDKNVRYSLPNETDHIYANCGETMRFRELASEIANLKALLLLHLDLVQQQSEALAVKDRQMTALRQENDTLKQRIERMERRISLQLSRQKQDSTEQENGVSSVITNNNNSEDKLSAENNSYPSEPSNVQTLVSPSPRKRNRTALSVKTLASTNATKENTIKKSKVVSKKIKKETEMPQPATDNIVIDPSFILNVENTVEIQDSIIPAEKKVETKKLKKVPKSKDVPSIYPEHRRIQKALLEKPTLKEPNLLKKDYILTTNEPYPTLVGESFQSSELLETSDGESDIEVPQWCEKAVETLDDTSNTEILDDEVFMKRHQKHELDEKRRKRWDLQRAREQRQYERLRARYEGEDRSQDRCPSRSSSKTHDPSASVTSFWAQPLDASRIQVEDWLPVSAFGAPLPSISQTDFSLPWSVNARPAKSDGKKKSRR